MPDPVPLTLTWSLCRRGDEALEVSYTVRNPGPTSVWLLDRPLYYPEQGVAVDDARIQVRGAPDGLVRLVRGHVAPRSLPAFELGPGARELPAGAARTGAARVPWPLRTWHPNELEADPISADRAVLEVGFVRSTDALETRALADGTTIRAARPGRARTAQELVVGAPLSVRG